ncbi:MAG: HD domain-containing protein [Streptococcaceae bacterium]|jgi:HD superfamily phosphohydrolase|nr:HD domain-containing protein [Streptococcaceae bacterium]
MIPEKERLINEKVFRDPVHNYIKVDHPIILDLINAKEMQRLRHIKQLGTSSFTFHGSEHSRFTHALGVYEIARKICNVFKCNYPKNSTNKDGWDNSKRLLTLTSALLHDIGHGAYSHTFEHIFNTDHEQFTIDIITFKQTEVFQILHSFAKDFPKKVAEVIQKTYKNQQVVQIISSQIDADRMDYLLRDAYYTGTKYGTFDLTRILRTIRPVKGGIAFKASGMHAVEDYIISRYQMYMQVYFHPTSRAMEIILKHLLKRACTLYQKMPAYFKQTTPFLLPFLKGKYKLKDYLCLNDDVLNTYFAEWKQAKDFILSDLAKRFLDRKPLKSCAYLNKDKPIIDEMKKLVAAVGFDPDYYTALNSSYDLPYDFYRPNTKNTYTQIEIMQKNGQLKELSTMSPLVFALAGNSHGDQRFYFPKEMLDNSLTSKFNKEIKKFNQLFSSVQN